MLQWDFWTKKWTNDFSAWIVEVLGAAAVRGGKEKHSWFSENCVLLTGLASGKFIYWNRAWALVIWVTVLARLDQSRCLWPLGKLLSHHAPEKVCRSNLLPQPTAQPLTGKKPCTLLLSRFLTEVKGQALNPLFIKRIHWHLQTETSCMLFKSQWGCKKLCSAIKHNT